MPLAAKVHREVEKDLRRRLDELIGEERDVVLDFSFWSRSMRDEWRAVVESRGTVPEIIYLATDRATCLARVAARVRADGDDFTLDAKTAAAYFDHFERPTSDEGPLRTVAS